ncbi:MAG: 2'-5' RNA ligase [Parcubacteria group bacterium GW2011_GWA2_51_10]|nr:MAG: 2'-5' RNA ligase [Parcubacteria group bacterium GW2011_GWA2_51_10]
MKFHDAVLTKKNRPKVHRRRWGVTLGEARRVFVGIRVEGDAADTIATLQEGLPSIPMRVIPKRDLHLTLVPPWLERDIPSASKRLRDAIERPFAFPLKFKYLEYGPSSDAPFLIWITCDASKKLLELKKRLLKALGKKEEVPFIPHVTVARLRGSFANSFKNHHLGKRVPLTMTVNALELLGSPHRGGIGYETLEKISLHREEETPR